MERLSYYGSRKAFERDLYEIERCRLEAVPWEETELTEKGYLVVIHPESSFPKSPSFSSGLPLFSLSYFAIVVAPFKVEVNHRRYDLYQERSGLLTDLWVEWPKRRIFLLSGEEPHPGALLWEDFVILSGSKFWQADVYVCSEVRLPLLKEAYRAWYRLPGDSLVMRSLSIREGLRIAKELLLKEEAMKLIEEIARKKPLLFQSLRHEFDPENPIAFLRLLEEAIQDDFTLVDLAMRWREA